MAMANTAEITGVRAALPWWIVPAGAVAAVTAIGAPLHLFHAADGRGEMILARNEVMQEALGGRTWFGALANASDRALADVAVHIRFHDGEGRPVGTPVSARAVRLGPGDRLHLQARLPAGATGLQVHALRWTRGGRTVDLGPGAPLPFGAVQD